MTDEGWRFDDVAIALDEGDLELETFTDEELAATLGDLLDDGFYIDLPVYEALDASGRELACRTAARSLLARGLVTPDADPQEGGEPAAGVAGDLATILHFLSEPSAVVIADFEHAGEPPVQRAWLALDDVAVLDHQPDGAGLHRFVLRSPSRAASALLDALDPERAATDDDTPVEHFDGDPVERWAEVEEAIARGSVVCRLFATRPADGEAMEHELLSAATDSGLWLLGAALSTDGRPGRRATPVSRETLAGVALALLGQVGEEEGDR